METTVAVVAGAMIALIGSLPLARALELGFKDNNAVSVQHGLVRLLVSFTLSSILLFLAYLVFAGEFFTCGIAFVVVLVVVWSIETVRAFLLFH